MIYHFIFVMQIAALADSETFLYKPRD